MHIKILLSSVQNAMTVNFICNCNNFEYFNSKILNQSLISMYILCNINTIINYILIYSGFQYQNFIVLALFFCFTKIYTTMKIILIFRLF